MTDFLLMDSGYLQTIELLFSHLSLTGLNQAQVVLNQEMNSRGLPRRILPKDRFDMTLDELLRQEGIIDDCRPDNTDDDLESNSRRPMSKLLLDVELEEYRMLNAYYFK